MRQRWQSQREANEATWLIVFLDQKLGGDLSHHGSSIIIIPLYTVLLYHCYQCIYVKQAQQGIQSGVESQESESEKGVAEWIGNKQEKRETGNIKGRDRKASRACPQGDAS